MAMANENKGDKKLTEQIGFNIPKELLTPIIRETVSAAIIKELGDPSEVIRLLVGRALSERVSSNGKKSSYDYENKFTYLELMTGKYIRELAAEVLREIFQQRRDDVKAAVRQSLEKSGDLGDIICKGFYESLTSEWHSTINVTLSSSGE